MIKPGTYQGGQGSAHSCAAGAAAAGSPFFGGPLAALSLGELFGGRGDAAEAKSALSLATRAAPRPPRSQLQGFCPLLFAAGAAVLLDV